MEQILIDFQQNRIKMDQYKILVDSLKLVGLSFKEQKRYLPDFVEDVQEDVISEFDSAFKLIPQLMDANKLSYKAVSKILSCYILIDMNLDREDLTSQSFEYDESWEKVRELAKEALREMGESNALSSSVN